MNCHVLHVVRDFLPYSETFTYQTILAVNEKTGREERVFSFFRSHPDRFPYGQIDALFGTSLELGYKKSRFSPAFFIHLLTHFRQYLNLFFYRYAPVLLSFRMARFAKGMEQSSPGIMHFHFGWTFHAFWRLRQGRLPDIPMVITFHGSDVTRYARMHPDYVELLKEMSRKDNFRFITVSTYLREELRKLGIPERKIAVVSNSFNEELFRLPAKVPENEVFQVLNVSRFVSWKGHEYLIRAFSEFVQKTDAHLWLVGEGELRERLESLVRELGVSSHVTFTGPFAPEKVASLMAKSDVYVQPSFTDGETGQCETFGVVVLEAIASGLPVIVTDSGGLPEVVGNDTAHAEKSFFIVPEKNENEIVSALGSVSKARSRADNEYVRERLEKFSRARFTERLFQVYEEARGKNAK